jgi:hypothetical protein
MKIEKNIPLPRKRDRFGKFKSVTREMDINDSVFFTDRNQANNFSAALRSLSMKPRIRKVEGGHRVWRIE